MQLTPLGKRAEKRLAALMHRAEAYQGLALDRLHGADTRDRINQEIDVIEGKFADETSNYWVQPKGRTQSIRRE
jgi:hypothetical protein